MKFEDLGWSYPTPPRTLDSFFIALSPFHSLIYVLDWPTEQGYGSYTMIGVQDTDGVGVDTSRPARMLSYHVLPHSEWAIPPAGLNGAHREACENRTRLFSLED